MYIYICQTQFLSDLNTHFHLEINFVHLSAREDRGGHRPEATKYGYVIDIYEINYTLVYALKSKWFIVKDFSIN